MHNLKENDKQKIRDNLFSQMEQNPVREKGFARYINWKPQLPTLKLNLQFMPIKTIVAALLAALVFGAGATAFAAEGSLPGDTLYPVQGASEKVRGWMKFSSENKAEWHAKMTEKRLTELDKLVSDGKITEEQKTKLEEKVQKRVDMANKQFERMKARGNAGLALGIASKLEGSLKAREHIFRGAGKAFGKLAEKDAKFAEKFQKEADFVAKKRAQLESKVKDDNSEKMKTAAEGKMKAAESKIAEVKKYIEDNKNKIDAEALKKAQDKLDEAKLGYDDGKLKFGEKKYGEAFVFFTKAHRLAQYAKIIAIGKELKDAKPFIHKIKPFGFFKKVRPSAE